MLAAESGKAEAVELLLNAGSNRWVEDAQQHTALDLAEAGGHQRVLALLQAPPGAEERVEGLPRSLNGADFVVNAALHQAVESLLVPRGFREETVPVMLEGVEDGKALLRVLPQGKAEPVEQGRGIGGTGWILEQVRTGEGRPASWQFPQVSLRNPGKGLGLVLVKGLPGRAGRSVAVLEFGPAREVYEALPGDAFAISNATVRHFVVDAVAPLLVELHDTAKPGAKVVLKAGR